MSTTLRNHEIGVPTFLVVVVMAACLFIIGLFVGASIGLGDRRVTRGELIQLQNEIVDRGLAVWYTDDPTEKPAKLKWNISNDGNKGETGE